MASEINTLSCTAELPNEVLSRIFFHRLHFPEWNDRVIDGYINERWHRSPAPASRRWVRVAHVCQRWRSVAFSLPELWTNIQMLLHQLNRKNGRVFNPFVHMQSHYSRNRPISLQAFVSV